MIEDFWETDSDQISWWSAEVLSIKNILSSNMLAISSIIYDKKNDYGEQMWSIELINGQILRPELS